MELWSSVLLEYSFWLTLKKCSPSTHAAQAFRKTAWQFQNTNGHTIETLEKSLI